PTDWDKSERAAFANLRHVENGDCVNIGIGHEQRLFVWREGDTVRSVPGGRIGLEFGQERFDFPAGTSLQNANGVAIGVGHEEVLARFAEQQLVRMLLRWPAFDDSPCLKVDDRDRGLGPESDIKAAALFIEHTTVREWIGGLRLVEQRLRPLEDGGLIV